MAMISLWNLAGGLIRLSYRKDTTCEITFFQQEGGHIMLKEGRPGDEPPFLLQRIGTSVEFHDDGSRVVRQHTARAPHDFIE